MYYFSVFVVLLTIFKQATSEYVYVVEKIPSLPCIENPIKDTCNLDYKIPDYNGQGNPGANETTLNDAVNAILSIWKLSSKPPSDECKVAVKNYYCSSFSPVCHADYIEINGQKTRDACEKATQECTGLPAVSTFFPCSSLKEQKIDKYLDCTDFPIMKNDPYPCSTGMYNEKYLGMFTNNQSHVNKLITYHTIVKMAPNLATTCRKNISDVLCKLWFPVCSKDKKYVVTFISREECNENIECLNVDGVPSVFLNKSKESCKQLPSINDMRLTISQAFGGGTSITVSIVPILVICSLINLVF